MKDLPYIFVRFPLLQGWYSLGLLVEQDYRLPLSVLIDLGLPDLYLADKHTLQAAMYSRSVCADLVCMQCIPRPGKSLANFSSCTHVTGAGTLSPPRPTCHAVWLSSTSICSPSRGTTAPHSRLVLSIQTCFYLFSPVLQQLSSN